MKNTRFHDLIGHYPRQFWLLLAGMFVSTLGASMIWPFLTIYVSESLELPLATVAGLISLNAVIGLVFSFIAGPVTDRFGRKWVMVFSLIMNGMAYLLMSQASSLPAFALLMALSGAVNPLYRVGVDAMMADLVPPAKRMDGFSLLRTSNNLGIALGPAIGGVLATISYTLAFYGAAVGLMGYGLLIAIFAAETLPKRGPKATLPREKFGGYAHIFQDRPFISFVVIFCLTQMCATLIWVLMAVYAKQNFQVPESRYGFIPATNAIMVVILQLPVTQVTKRYPPLLMLAVGSLFYAFGVGSVALGQAFWGFWLSMVILTVGELILTPTANAYTANLAPPDMRGRYMSLYGLTWGVAAAIAPIMGGYLNDNFGPVYIWYAGFIIGMIGTMGFLLLSKRYSQAVVRES